MKKITESIAYVGVNDLDTVLFEGQYRIPNGISYNSYVIFDEKIAVTDTVDASFTHEWLDSLDAALGERRPDYLIVQHMEPDHSANITAFLKIYPDTAVVASAKAFTMMEQFFGAAAPANRIVVGDGDSLSLGERTLNFITAPMVHWPEVIMTYDTKDRVLFSADGFGKFGIPDDGADWTDEARRYYIGIVGKYGAQVQAVLKKAARLDISIICPLHGPVLTEELGKYIGLYDTWSSYHPESEGVVIAYASVYGHTAAAAMRLAKELKARGCPEVLTFDLTRCDLSEAVSRAFQYNKLVLASITYNADIFPAMKGFINALTERGFRSRTVALIENGSWAPQAAKTMRTMLEGCKDITLAEGTVKILSALNNESSTALEALAEELCREYIALSGSADKNDVSSLSNIGYGLYLVATNDGRRDNGLIVNTVTQVSDSPNRVAVTVSKQNYSFHTIRQTGAMNVNCLTVDTPFSVFESFGFRSGRAVDKFEGYDDIKRSDNGLVFIPRYINSYFSLKVEDYVDLGSHGMFICSVTEARRINDRETMTYSYYGRNVKPRPDTEGKKGFVCKVCGFVYEGDRLPEDYICPLCKHGVADFEPISSD